MKQNGINERILAREIVRAFKEYEVQKEIEINKKEQQEQLEWLDILGYKNYDQNENLFLRCIHYFRNITCALLRIIFFNRKEANDARATLALMVSGIIIVFYLCEWSLYIIAISIFSLMVKAKVTLLIGLPLFFSFLLLARIFRIARFEIENIRERNIIIAIFSSVLSFVAVIIAVITIIID